MRSLALQFKPCYVEPAFTLYYPDMVYSNPRIAEVDLLLIFEGGYVCVELKKKASKAPEDSLKYFVNGLAQQPVFYVYSERENFGGIQYPAPSLIPRKGLDFLDGLIGGEGDLRSYMHLVKEERGKLFSLDNFLRLLLIYGSPSVCKSILSSTFLSKLANEFQLVNIRRLQINKVKFLDRVVADNALSSVQTVSENNATKYVDKLIAVITILRNKTLQQRVAKAISDFVKPSTREVILLCTGESKKDAEEVKKMLDPSVQARIEVIEIKQDENVEEAWASGILKLCEHTCMILFVGEVPKGVLVKIVEMCESKEPKPRLAVLAWKPQLDLERLMQGLKVGDVMEVEKVELNVIEL